MVSRFKVQGSRFSILRRPPDSDDPHRRREPLALGGRHLDPADDVHAGDDAAEDGEALSVRVAGTVEVECGLRAEIAGPGFINFRLRSDARLIGPVSGPSRAIETAPSTCDRPVTLVRSSAIGGKYSFSRPALAAAWMTSILTLLVGWLSIVTVRWNRPPS